MVRRHDQIVEILLVTIRKDALVAPEEVIFQRLEFDDFCRGLFDADGLVRLPVWDTDEFRTVDGDFIAASCRRVEVAHRAHDYLDLMEI